MIESEQVRDFSELITDLRHGNCHQEISRKLRDATEAAKRTGKVAEVTLKLKIKPCGDRQVEVTDNITTKIPQPTQMPTVMFIDESNNLNRSDRRQMGLSDVKVVGGEKPLVTIDQETGVVSPISVN